MSDTAKRRLAIDLDEIERQLQQSAPQRGGAGGHGSGAGGGHEHGGAPSGKPDPLAELARIVGQDDPFRGILSGERAGAEPQRANPDHDAVFGDGRGAVPPQPPAAAGGAFAQPREPQEHQESWSNEPPAEDPRAYAAQPQAPQDFADWLPQDQQAGSQPQAPYPAAHGAQDQGWPQMPPPAQASGYAQQQPPEWREEDLYADPRHASAPAAYPGHDPAYGDPARPDLNAPPVYAARQRGAHDAYPAAPAMAAGEAYGSAQAEYDAYGDALDDLDHAPRLRRERGGGKAMMTIGVVLGVAVIGVASALYFVRSTGPTADGEPPLITAESEPMRIEPVNPGGVEIPDQDRQIFERSAEDETRVVDREEQPVDVGEIARSSPRVVLPPPAATQGRDGAADPIAQVLAGTMEPQTGFEAPPEVSAAVAELGEPRRVRTVTVRPDGTIIRNGDDAPRQTAALDTPSEFSALADATIPAPATERMPWEPDPATEAAADSASETEAPQALADAPAQNTAQAQADQPASEPAPAPAPRGPMALTGAMQIAPQAQQQSAPAQSPQQTASVQPSQPAATGDYVVQLGISNSEDRAQAAFNQFRDRYSGIIGDANPIVRRAEVNGNTIYRVRVGPYDLSSANSVCDRIKNAGGDCFVARN